MKINKNTLLKIMSLNIEILKNLNEGVWLCLRVDIDDAFSLLISIGICEYLNQCSAIVIGRRQ